MEFKSCLVLSAIILGTAGAALAQERNSLKIPQVSQTPKSASTVGEKEKAVPIDESLDESKLDQQTLIMRDPNVSDFARGQSIINSNTATRQPGADLSTIRQDATHPGHDESKLGGNLAIVKQDGGANRSTVNPSGQANTAIQTQKGENNDITLKQQGDTNRSHGAQAGKNTSKATSHNEKKAVKKKDEKDKDKK